MKVNMADIRAAEVKNKIFGGCNVVGGVFPVYFLCSSETFVTFELFTHLQKNTCSPVSWTSAGKRCRRRASSWRWEGARGCDGGRPSAPDPSGGRRETHTHTHIERLIKTVLTLTCKSTSLLYCSLCSKEKTGCLKLSRKPGLLLSFLQVIILAQTLSRID